LVGLLLLQQQQQQQHPQAIGNIEREQGEEQEQEQEEQKNPVSYAFKFLNSPETQRQYPKRLKLLFDHIGLAGGEDYSSSSSLEAQGQAFLDKTDRQSCFRYIP
jgi:hypothetical protein